MSNQRRKNVNASYGRLTDPTVRFDSAANGLAALVLEFDGSTWATAAQCEAWYDAQGITLGSVHLIGLKGASVGITGSWSWSCALLDDDVATSFDTSGEMR